MSHSIKLCKLKKLHPNGGIIIGQVNCLQRLFWCLFILTYTKMKTEVIQVILTNETKGEGTEHDPVRRVLQLWTFEGKLIVESSYLFSDPVINEYK